MITKSPQERYVALLQTLLICLTACLTLSVPATAKPGIGDAKWAPAQAPLLTRFAKEVNPDHPRPEYPRPLMVRKEWQSLNGLWEFAFDDNGMGQQAGWISGKPLPERILVPFTFESALSGIGKGKEIHERVWYRRLFTVPKGWRNRRVLLNFGAVDWQTTVYVNGKEVGQHTGGYSPFSLDITDALKTGGQNDGQQELVVKVYDPADPSKAGWQPKGKQLGSSGIWYTRTTGIWQSVWIEPVAITHLESVRLEGDPGRKALTVSVSFTGVLPASLHVTILDKGQEYKTQYKLSGFKGTYHIPFATRKLWTPETPNLYDVKVELYQQDSPNDTVMSYVGFRKVGIDKGRLTLNGRPYFYRGVLDQGYWPDGILTPPSDSAIKNDVEMIKKLGFNMARKHVKVEDPRWYYWCDRLGVAVWQDMPSSHNLSTQPAQENFVREWTDLIATTSGYPCVVHWIPFNENWGNPQEFQDKIVTLTRDLDPTRPITDASGWTQRGLTDVIDAHDYSNDLKKQGVEHPTKPKVVGEFGGIALPIQDHTWTTGWGYQTVRNSEGLIRRIRYQTTQLFEAANLSGYVYTQLTDVEQELNGLLTYDRLPKADPKQLEKVFTGQSWAVADEVAYIRDWLILGPISSGTNLTTADDTDANRAVMAKILSTAYLSDEAKLAPKENDPAKLSNSNDILIWKRVKATSDTLDFHQIFGGQHDNAVVYAVAIIDSPKEVKNATLLLGSDDGATVWLNGEKVFTTDHIRGVALDGDSVERLTLRQGRNVLVIKVGQGMGGWGLAARFETTNK